MTTPPGDITKVLVTPEQLIGYCIDDRYRLESIVGGGGMGVVYRTRQENLNRDVAIKLLKLEDGHDGHRLERFRREIDIVSKMSHPNIVRVFDSGRDPALGLNYIVMELVDGLPLDDVMRGHRLDTSLAIDIAHEVCAALTEPHGMGIIHRDIKPANVIVYPRSDDTVGVKVLDFGIARAGRRESSRITTTGVVVGSPMYMAPEVARGQDLDARTDLYSVGVMMYEMLSGKTPFAGATPVAIMLRHAVEDPPSLAESAPAGQVPADLVEFVDTLLSKEREGRPEDARAVLRRIAQIRKSNGIGRPTIDGRLPPHEALRGLRHPVASEPADESADGANPYSATQPWQEDERPDTGSDSFSGWLVPELARHALVGTISTESPSLPDLQSETRGRGLKAVAVAISLVAVAAIAIGLVTSKEPEEIAIASPVERETPAARLEPGQPEPEEPLAEAVVPTSDAGGSWDVGAEADVAPAKPPVPKVVPRARQRPKVEKTPATAERPPGVDNLEWINQK